MSMSFKTQHPTKGHGYCVSHVDIVAWTHVWPSLLELFCGTSPPCPLPASLPAAARPSPQPAPLVHTPCISGKWTDAHCQKSTDHWCNSDFGTRDSIHSFLHMNWTTHPHMVGRRRRRDANSIGSDEVRCRPEHRCVLQRINKQQLL